MGKFRHLRTVALLLTLSACMEPVSKIDIVNKGRNDITDLVVATPEATWRLGDLPRGRTIRFAERLEGEGGPMLSWTVAGRRVSEQGCYYTGGVPASGTIDIFDTRIELECRWRG